MRRALLVTLLIALSSCRAPRAVPAVPPIVTAERTILEEHPTGEGRRFQVAIARCRERSCAAGECVGQRRECPIEVRLLEGATPRDVALLDWRCAPGLPARRALQPDGWRPSDALATGSQGMAWFTGEESTAMEILVRSVRLDRRRVGLLVDLHAGFEHVKRQHYLFAARGSRLSLAWRASDALAGPSWSTVAVLTRGDGQALLHVRGFDRFEAGEADDLGHEIVVWDEARQQLISRASDPSLPLYALVVGRYASAAGAIAARDRLAGCGPRLSVVAASSVPALRRMTGFVLLGISASRTVVEAARRSVVSCDRALQGTVVPLR